MKEKILEELMNQLVVPEMHTGFEGDCVVCGQPYDKSPAVEKFRQLLSSKLDEYAESEKQRVGTALAEWFWGDSNEFAEDAITRITGVDVQQMRSNISADPIPGEEK